MNKFHMAGNTHFDPAWLWTWDEAMASVRATFRAALDRMDEDPDFKYSFCTPAVFEWIENTDPELFERIRARVGEGRWDIAAEGWWLQPDCNCPSGESLVRQGLYAQRYLMGKFGMKADTMFNIDSFGHSAMMPQLMKKCGIDNYVYTRPNSDDQPLEDDLFEWVSPDGSSVLAYRCGNANDGCYPLDTLKCLRDRREGLKNGTHDAMIVFGVSDHGGAPTKKAIADIRAAMDEMDDVEVKFSDVPGFFREQKDRVTSEFMGELQPRFYGPFSDHAEVKKNNRRAEYALERAERAGFIANRLCGREYSPEKLRRSWKDVMFNQFHDILGGTCIPQVFVDARDQQGRAIHTANEETHFALQTIARRIQTIGNNKDSVWNLIVFNLSGRNYCGLCEGEVQWVWEFPWYEGGIEVVDEQGNVQKAQIINEKSAIPGFRSRFAFVADIPAMGWRTYAVRKTETPAERDVSGTDIQSPFVFRAYEDKGDVWCFNTTSGYGEAMEAPVPVERRTVEKGQLLTKVKQVWKLRDSLMEEYITKNSDGTTDWSCRVNWNEKHAVLKVLPVAEGADAITAAIPAGCIERPMDGREYPAGPWLKWGDTTLITEGIFAYDTADGLPRLTVLRSPIFGDLRTKELNYDLDYQYMGQGIHEARIKVVYEDLSPAEAAARADSWNSVPVVICEANHAGDLPSTHCGFRCEGAELMAVKPAEDGDGFVIRLAEREGKNTYADIGIMDMKLTAEMTPYEIKTLRVHDDGRIEETDMLEGL